MRTAALALALALAGCATTPTAQVLRFHQGQASGRGTVVVQPADPAMAGSLEFAAQANAVGAQLQRVGYAVVAQPAQAQHRAIVNITTGERLTAPRQSGVTVGVGGGFSTGNVGIGTNVRVPVGGQSQPNVVASTTLAVSITTSPGNLSVWEGRASIDGAARGMPSGTAAAPLLADALFRDFPGPNGRTVQVPLGQPASR